MDGQRFDEITKVLARGHSRRRALKLVGAGFASAVAGALGLRAASAAPRPGKCAGAGGTCSGKKADRPCCAGARCVNGFCCQDEHICGQEPAWTCADFQTDPANCGRCGVACENGVCLDGSCVRVNGQPCGSPSECASGFCVDGVCCAAACTGQCEACHLQGAVGTCIPVTGSPVGGRAACTGVGTVCGGACDGLHTAACTYPDATTACGDPPGCTGATATLARTCDGNGACSPAETVDCSPYFCGETTCLTSCVGPDDCTSGVCVEGRCCPGEDACEDFCCAPDRPETEVCCPFTGRCCECYVSGDTPDQGRPFCCEPAEKICQSATRDTCCHGDEDCVNGTCCWVEKHCEGTCCATQCCGGTCCGPWDACGLAGDGSEVCQPLATCTFATEETDCAGGGRCASTDFFGGSQICCPGDRFIELPIPDPEVPPENRYICCPFGEGPGQGANPFSCEPGPDYGGTFRGRATRI